MVTEKMFKSYENKIKVVINIISFKPVDKFGGLAQW